MKMTTCVKGSGSFVERALRRHCLQRGIIGVDSVGEAEVGTIAADLRDPSVADIMMEGYDSIVHLASLIRSKH